MPTSDEGELAALRTTLAELLASGTVGQVQVATAAGVDQGLVSRLKNGSVKRVTERTKRVARYVNMQTCDVVIPERVVQAMRAYLVGGGDPDLLCEQVALLGRIRKTSTQCG